MLLVVGVVVGVTGVTGVYVLLYVFTCLLSVMCEAVTTMAEAVLETARRANR